ncbi:MAG: hypothetical protein ACEQSM_04390 [Aliarcobacter sp.]
MSLLAAGLSYGMNKLLNSDAWKNSLIHKNRSKDIAILCEHSLQEGGATTGRGDNENGLTDFLPAKIWVKDMVKETPDSYYDPEETKQKEKESNNDPAPQLKRAS